MRTIWTWRPTRRCLRASTPPIAARTGNPSPPATTRTMIVDWTTTASPSPGAARFMPWSAKPALQKAETLWKTAEKSRPSSGTMLSGRCR